MIEPNANSAPALGLSVNRCVFKAAGRFGLVAKAMAHRHKHLALHRYALPLRVRDHVGVSRHFNHVVRAHSPLHSKLGLFRIPTIPRDPIEASAKLRPCEMALTKESPLPVCLSVCVQRAALKTPPPSGRTLSFPEPAGAPLKRCGLLPPGKLWSPSAGSVHSPREGVATAHPSGKHVTQTADKPE